ncbi:MAG TPA: response regulator transcription factor [Candidatus Dormibacteraeota bacterium]|nr:response regulator transcription factor [Candidatus Dormibacteraeota bacterium]
MKRPRVLLVDDMPEILRYCSGILAPDFEIVGTAATGPAAIEAVAATEPDLIVLDISMPGLNGIEVARRLRRSGCQAVIVFVSADDALSEETLAAGGSAYVSKTLIDLHLRTAIAEAMAGRRFVRVCESGSGE